MIEVKEIVVAEENPNVGCNNGELEDLIVRTFDNKRNVVREFPIRTCRCRKGCNGSDRCPDVGMTFKNAVSLIDWMTE